MPRNLKKKKHQFLTQERNSILQCNMISFVVSIIFTILIILYVYYSFYFDTTRVILIHRSNSLVFKSYIISQLLFSHESISLTRIMEIHMEKKQNILARHQYKSTGCCKQIWITCKLEHPLLQMHRISDIE